MGVKIVLHLCSLLRYSLYINGKPCICPKCETSMVSPANIILYIDRVMYFVFSWNVVQVTTKGLLVLWKKGGTSIWRGQLAYNAICIDYIIVIQQDTHAIGFSGNHRVIGIRSIYPNIWTIVINQIMLVINIIWIISISICHLFILIQFALKFVCFHWLNQPLTCGDWIISV